MKMWKLVLPAAAILLCSGQAVAQSLEEDKEEMKAREAEYAERLREAEERMERAAREIAEITSERLPDMEMIERRFEFSTRPRIGITIDGSEESGAVEAGNQKSWRECSGSRLEGRITTSVTSTEPGTFWRADEFIKSSGRIEGC